MAVTTLPIFLWTFHSWFWETGFLDLQQADAEERLWIAPIGIAALAGCAYAYHKNPGQ
jgi:hypothetical protein